jgi:hypothetical protein
MRIRLAGAQATMVSVGYRLVDEGYLPTINAKLKAGRFFETAVAGGYPTAVVNQTFVSRFGTNGSALGNEFYANGWYRIVGEIDDIREGPLRDPLRPVVYLRFRPENWLTGAPWLVIRGPQANAPAFARRVREAIRSFAPDVPYMASTTLTTIVNEETRGIRFVSAAVSGLALFGLGLAILGIAGAIRYSVNTRRRELAIRLALGAGHKGLTMLVALPFMAVAVLAVAVGTVLSVTTSDVIASYLYGIRPNDPLVLTAMGAVLLVAVCVAAWVPATAGLAIDPVRELQ